MVMNYEFIIIAVTRSLYIKRLYFIHPKVFNANKTLNVSFFSLVILLELTKWRNLYGVLLIYHRETLHHTNVVLTIEYAM